MQRFFTLPLLPILSLLYAAPAAASDGVVEINQTCAVNAGCLAGDTGGFPVTISQSGSYRLTGDLSVSSAGTTAIDVTTRDVTIDLNGFSIRGVTTCTRAAQAVTCTPTGSGYGIRANSADGSGTENVTVRNGTIRGMGFFGVALSGNQSRIENVRAWSNGLSGLVVNGVSLSRGGAIVDSTSSLNGADGFYVGSRGLARGNTATDNDGAGITAIENSLVVDNTLSSNVGVGLFISTGSGYARNVITDNNGGSLNSQVSGTGVEVGTNLCGFDTTCP